MLSKHVVRCTPLPKSLVEPIKDSSGEPTHRVACPRRLLPTGAVFEFAFI
ncbi:MAG TPA: hypothetical protein VMV33_14555 [Rhodocyclaceae bacterium]|nr:hypothetical protein [Rhodocyclaceae bacterium]